MNGIATTKAYENLAIPATLHWHAKITKELVFYNGGEVLINIQSHKPHKINYKNSPIYLYKLLIIIHFMIFHDLPFMNH